MTDSQIGSVRRFAERGGGVLASGETSLCNEWGEPRPDLALADLLGAHVLENRAATSDPARRRWAHETQHTYLRLAPTRRHPVLRGFEETDILPFGGGLAPLKLDPGTEVPLTFIPAFPVYPPETAWMRQPQTDVPGLVLRTTASGARIAYLPADLDRRFARDNLPDHGNLLANLIRWAARDAIPLTVEGPGLIDCYLYRQPGRLILHLVNLTSAGTWRQPIHESIPVGPLQIKMKLPEDVRGTKLRLLVSSQSGRIASRAGWTTFTINSIRDHEVAIIGPG
jgi:hypothetical protein